MENFEKSIGDSEKLSRPNQGDMLDKLDIYKRAESEHRGGGKYIKEEIRQYIKDEGEPEVREQFYSGWEKEDFERLLKLIEQENE
jgi:hypothetical protein